MIGNLMTCSEIADFLGVTTDHASYLCHKGKIAGAQKIAGVWFTPRDNVFLYKKLLTRTKKQNAIKRRQKKKDS